MTTNERLIAKSQFPDDFEWGVATSAFQIEGASAQDGKGPSIWDSFCRSYGAIADNSKGDIACEHYSRWASDLDMIKNLGVDAYRFCISWPRVRPTAAGTWNEKGLDFYERLVDGMLDRNIKPYLTLNHWDLPDALQANGGWANCETVHRFVEYAQGIQARMGDRIASIATHNEPWVIAVLGHETGVFAPGVKSRAAAAQVSHHLLLSHGLAEQTLRAQGSKAKLGIVLNLSQMHPATPSAADHVNAQLEDGRLLRWYLDPLFKASYPQDVLDGMSTDAPLVQVSDLKNIAVLIDFLGVNYYSRTFISADNSWTPGNNGLEVTEMDWEVYPEGLTELLLRIQREYPVPPIYVTENGGAFKDELVDGQVHDLQRTCYLQRHMNGRPATRSDSASFMWITPPRCVRSKTARSGTATSCSKRRLHRLRPANSKKDNTMGQVSLRGIRKSYDTTEVIRGIDLDVLDGEFLVFVGPSGCGKSTTLRMIAGLETISSGDLLIDGTRANDLRPSDRGAAMVFQSYALYPHMTVAENMGFSLKMAGVSRAKRSEQVGKTAEVLRILDLLERYPKELSGGQRQRVAIGRAIVRKPKVFLFDEPLSNLDAALRVDMRIELSRLHKELRTTMIYVTHDQVEAMTMGDRIAVFNKGEIEQIGGPMDLYSRPANEFVAGFIGSPRINFIDHPEEGNASVQHVALWQELIRETNGDACRLGIRPEHVSLGAPEQGVQATVELVEQLGDSAMVHLRIKGIAHLLIAKITASGGVPCAGQSVGLTTGATSKTLAFDSLGKTLAVR